MVASLQDLWESLGEVLVDIAEGVDTATLELDGDGGEVETLEEWSMFQACQAISPKHPAFSTQPHVGPIICPCFSLQIVTFYQSPLQQPVQK